MISCLLYHRSITSFFVEVTTFRINISALLGPATQPISTSVASFLNSAQNMTWARIGFLKQVLFHCKPDNIVCGIISKQQRHKQMHKNRHTNNQSPKIIRKAILRIPETSESFRFTTFETSFSYVSYFLEPKIFPGTKAKNKSASSYCCYCLPLSIRQLTHKNNCIIRQLTHK